MTRSCLFLLSFTMCSVGVVAAGMAQLPADTASVLTKSANKMGISGEVKAGGARLDPNRVRATYWVDAVVGGGWIQQIPEGRQVIPLGNYYERSVKLSIQPNDFYSTLYHRPRYGIAFYMATFNTKAVGAPYAIYPWYEIPFIRPTLSQRFSVGHMGGFGVSWNLTPYNPHSPTPNIYIGSEVNCAVELGFYSSYRVTKNLHMSLSVGFKHFSNGSLKKPNRGINLVPIALGVRYQLNDQTQQGYLHYSYSKDLIPPYLSHWRHSLAVGTGLRQEGLGDSEHGGDTRYAKYTIIAYTLYQFSYKWRLGGGVDFFISSNSAQRNQKQQQTFSDWASPAIIARGEWMIHRRVSIPFGVGTYMLSNNRRNGEVTRFYERIGVKADVLSGIYVSLGIKAHAAQADFFELSVGYTFHKDKNSYRFAD